MPAEKAIQLIRSLCLVTLLILSGSILLVASPEDPQEPVTIEEVIQAYEELQYDRVETMAMSLLTEGRDLTPKELVELHKILAIVTFSSGSLNESENSFRSALSIDPDLMLDSLYVSPKILTFFRDVKSRFLAETEGSEVKEIRYIVMEDKRPAAAVRSVIFPGWGQLYKGEKRKGFVILAVASGAAVGALISHISMTSAHDLYLDASEASDIERKYDNYNRLYKVRNSLILSTAVTWAYSYLDASLRETPERKDLLHRLSLGSTPGNGISSPRLFLSISLR